MPSRKATPEDGLAYEMGCELWTGYKDARGRPVLRTRSTSTLAARVLWERENGPVPDGLRLGTLCGTKDCVRSSHRTPSTPAEIAYRAGLTALTPRLADRARLLVKAGYSKRRIADAMNVDEATIRRICAGRYWPETGEKAPS
jgi:hypothetical protein